MSEFDLETVELSIKAAKKTVATAKSVERLRKNRDFKQVVLDGFFQDEAVRLVTLKADPNLQSAENQESIIKQMDAIGAFQQYLNTCLALGNMAEKALEEDEATREEILAEGL